MTRAGLAEALTGNMSVHALYCVRQSERREPADPAAPDAVPVAREMPGPEIARNIRSDGTLPFLFDGLRVPVPLPPQAAAILALVDGQRTVEAIGAELAARGTGREAFARAWAATWGPLERVNRLLLAPPAA